MMNDVALGNLLLIYIRWDSGMNVGEFDGHSRRVLSCAFKPTRPFRIVTCGEDFLVNFYEGPPFKFKLSQRDHSNFVNCVRFSPDGSKFMTVSSDKKGLLYDAKSGEKIGELSSEDGHKGSIYAVSWSPDGKQVWRVPLHGDQCGDAESVDIGSQPKDLSLALNSSDLAIVSTDSGVVILRGTKIVSNINLGFAATASAIAPDCNEAIIGGQDGKLHIYSISGDTLTEEAVLEKHRGAISVIH